MVLGERRRVPAVFAHVEFGSSLLVTVVDVDAVDFPAVRFERTALRERLAAHVTLKGTDTCVYSRMSL